MAEDTKSRIINLPGKLKVPERPKPVELLILEGTPQSEYRADLKCPVCGAFCDKNARFVSIYELHNEETRSGFSKCDGAVEIHCDCGWHFWYHDNLEGHFGLKDRYQPGREQKVATCEDCSRFRTKDRQRPRCGTERYRIYPVGKKEMPCNGRYFAIRVGDEKNTGE